MFLLLAIMTVLVVLTLVDAGQWPSERAAGSQSARSHGNARHIAPRRRGRVPSLGKSHAAQGASSRSVAAARWWWE